MLTTHPGPSQVTAHALGDDSKPKDDAPAVRFASLIEEISPSAAPPAASQVADYSFAEVAADELKSFTKSLQGRHLQERRMNTFQFEAFSLPPSRVPSREDESTDSTRLPTPNSSNFHSPHGSPRLSALASPPLTPAGTDPSAVPEKRISRGPDDKGPGSGDPQTITPQASSSHDKSPAFEERKQLAHRPASSDHVMQRSSSVEDGKSHRRGMFGAGPGSVPVSRESSPSRSSASNFYSKPITPGGDANDPYAKGKRPPQQAHPSRHTIDPRFVFSRKKKHGSPSSSKTSLTDKRASGMFGKSDEHLTVEGAGSGLGHAPQGSMADLKRFFRMSGHNQQRHHHHKKRDQSPASGARTPPTSRSANQQLPFSDDHGLSSRYGKLGKVLGAGAGGSVRLMRRKEDNTVFAVKEFRARHSYETEKEYNKKVTAEFCVGSTLHHGNIIETLDILQEKGRWFEVMEYAPFDLFAIVMTGRMSREEIRCCFLQILNGVTYLHSVGLAHRDLKLDNVVVSDKGIMKIIDFGSAHVFKYPFENDTVPAKGIVGSDPYLAPEVYDVKEYDAAAVDIWSLAIIFCCMTLRRFPWKIPRMTDNSFKLFAADPTPGHDPTKLITHSKSTGNLSSTVAREFLADEDVKEKHHRNHSQHSHHEGGGHHHGTEGSETSSTAEHSQQSQNHSATGERKEVIRGPWRILRLLPRESRHIIHRMLDLDPKTRAKMDEILSESWVADTVICQQLENGEVIPAEDHTHVLEPPASQHQQSKA
ncbi:Protein kinase-like domain protein [Metarhizium album ARSEF 1941]|uniref:non-specific serine/threonine protein kinase n=1 Tax=Metarhizium album (strain ARSEF 1941) TaxID=1081103 RepID=A0A0B2X8M8_METAS|nr:Protein kinase-like domain protein [Metarhizium album ARSEF 1941]KHO02128.1 Protein kinase-like domain protein [Metarhizium album ARSEF 1941]